MKDEQGGWKAADTALWREHLHAATMVGRVAAARVAVELGYAIEADPGPSGRLGHWKIAGVPDEVMELHSKRAAEIEAECQRRGEDVLPGPRRGRPDHPQGQAPRAGRPADGALAGRTCRGRLARRAPGRLGRRRQPAPGRARAARASKTPGRSSPRSWQTTATWPGARSSPAATWSWPSPRTCSASPQRCSTGSSTGPWPTPKWCPWSVWPAPAKRCTRSPRSSPGRPPSPRAWATSWPAPTPPPCPAATVEASHRKDRARLGARLSEEQRAAAVAICTSGRGAELVVGVAGAGKTTMLRAVADAFERAGYEVIGTATSGQAARNLGHEAEIGQSRTLASLIWRLDHGQLALSEKTVVILDEVGMTDDADLARLAAYVELAGAKLVLTGDHRQLGRGRPGRRAGRPGGAPPRRRPLPQREPPPARPGRAPSPRSVARRRRRRGRLVVRRAGPRARRPRLGTTPCRPPSTPGRPTWRPGTRPGCTPGGGPTWPS